MGSSIIEVYDRYTEKALRHKRPDLGQLRRTYGGFAIISRKGPNGPEVLVKLRPGPNGKYDLPGGGSDDDASNPKMDEVAVDEAWDEVLLRCKVIAAIGEPLHWVFNKQGVEVWDTAQAFLMEWHGEPSTSPEALKLAWIYDRASLFSLDLVGHTPDPINPIFGRMPALIEDGRSCAGQPFLKVPLTAKIRDLVVGDLRPDKFSLVDGGRYFGRPYWEFTSTGLQLYLALYYRLNPYEYKGRFTGIFD